ncbi:serine hydrolase domain-containing protein [Algibacter miyuki]|uniref:Serine hydrolase domain-containing protein n=1 Tax=Algibacter miyuki TaxID=1306933 RepID=A0ABV5GVW5_9FLAO|nr:serine hydrolase [Algibacter miyuki]MDN3665105.1 serine hydrolase [Algibacter miyuki]
MFKSLLFIISVLFISPLVWAQLEYDTPESVGLNTDFIQTKVDSIMQSSIKEYAFPGAQLLVAKNGKIIFHKAFGYHTYDSINKVNLNDIYDLASVTKIVGPLPALMKLYEEGKLDLDKPFSHYWKPWKHKKDKKHITLRELLAHQSGMKPYIIFLNSVTKKGKIKNRFVKTETSKRFSNKMYDGIFIKNRFKNKVFRQINRSKVSNEKVYNYSGLASLIYPEIIENLTQQSYTEYLQNEFYKPLGSETLGYLPSNKNFKNNIVPTEYDSIFRKTLVKGWVHDENAGLLGGISGNAGLFGTALDLAKYMQMLLQKGQYNNKQFLKPETVDTFTQIQYPENNNRRGLGFDKPLQGNDTLSLKAAYPAPSVSPQSFGHSGFTGTFIWADPVNDMIFIFLSNRVYPTRENRNIYDHNIRIHLQQTFYEATRTE